MNENVLGEIIIGCCINIHRTLGPGLLESVYEELLAYEITKAGHLVERQKVLDLNYDGHVIRNAFRADLIVEGKIILEIKSVEKIHKVHQMQVLTYLKITKLKLGYVLNFNQDTMTEGVRRVVNGL